MEPIIVKVQKITKHFLKPTSFFETTPCTALDDVSFELQRGKILGLIGPNGAGKTTLLKILTSLILPDSGSVYINDQTLDTDNASVKSDIGFMSTEERSFYWRLTGQQNLEFFAALYNLSIKDAEKKINELLTLFHIDYANDRFDSYSTGMKRKMALVRALLSTPSLLLLDEPTKSLDYHSQEELRLFIQNHIRGKKTAILATHNFTEAETLCDEFLILIKGRVYGAGSLEALKQKTGTTSLADAYLKLTKKMIIDA